MTSKTRAAIDSTLSGPCETTAGGLKLDVSSSRYARMHIASSRSSTDECLTSSPPRSSCSSLAALLAAQAGINCSTEPTVDGQQYILAHSVGGSHNNGASWDVSRHGTDAFWKRKSRTAWATT